MFEDNSDAFMALINVNMFEQYKTMSSEMDSVLDRNIIAKNHE